MRGYGHEAKVGAYLSNFVKCDGRSKKWMRGTESLDIFRY